MSKHIDTEKLGKLCHRALEYSCPMGEEVFDTEGMATFLKTAPNKIKTMVRLKQIPFIRLPSEDGNGFYIRFRLSEILRWLDELGEDGNVKY